MAGGGEKESNLITKNKQTQLGKGVAFHLSRNSIKNSLRGWIEIGVQTQHVVVPLELNIRPSGDSLDTLLPHMENQIGKQILSLGLKIEIKRTVHVFCMQEAKVQSLVLQSPEKHWGFKNNL